jgi:signal transduction histidine kinase
LPKPIILYIEDDPASQRLVQRTLDHAGYRVLLAARGLDGIDKARDQQPDLILTDINLPDLSGRELATALRSDPQFEKTPIVALTASGQDDQREMALAAGLSGFIAKPIDIDRLTERIAYYLEGGRDEIDPERLAAVRFEYLQEVVGRLETRIRQLESDRDTVAQFDQLKDTFIQITAHELRTPLTLVVGYSRLLEDHPPLKRLMQEDSSINSLIGGMINSIGRMQSAIEEILTISRIMSNEIDLSVGPTNLGTIVRRVIRNHEEVLNTRKLVIKFDEKQWPRAMRADEDLLQMAISNLLSNAIKYTPDGGKIHLWAQTTNKHVRFIVRDTGVGIDKTQQQTIFKRFHTSGDVSLHSTSKVAFGGGGLGLGLPICKGIIEAHGGRIAVQSSGHDTEKLPGSQFIVILPLNASDRPKQFGRLGTGALRQSS